MKISNLFLIRFSLILSALLCFLVLAACPSGKKDLAAQQEQIDEALAQIRAKEDERRNTTQRQVQEPFFDSSSTPQKKTVTLTNSETLNYELFPVRVDRLQEFIGLGGPPYYLESEDDWVVFTDDRRDLGRYINP